MKKQIIIILLGFVIFFLKPFPDKSFGAVLLDRVVATVNNEVITWSELMNVIALEGKTFLEDVPDDVRKDRMKELQRPFLNNLIDMKLQLQEARKMGLSIGDSELEGAISEIRDKYGMTEEVFMKSLSAEGLTMEDYKARLSDQILLQKVVNFAVKSKIVVTDREIEEYYESHLEDFSGEEKLKIRQIFFVKPRDESQKAEVEEKARNLFQRIVAGENFEKMASEFSEGPSRQFGGDLGYISRGSVLKEIEDAAFALKVEGVSNPFWSPAGLHIIKLEDRVEGGSLEKVRDKVQEIIYRRLFESKYREWMTGLKEEAYVDIKL